MSENREDLLERIEELHRTVSSNQNHHLSEITNMECRHNEALAEHQAELRDLRAIICEMAKKLHAPKGLGRL